MARPKRASTTAQAKEMTAVSFEETSALKSLVHSLASAGFDRTLDLKKEQVLDLIPKVVAIANQTQLQPRTLDALAARLAVARLDDAVRPPKQSKSASQPAA